MGVDLTLMPLLGESFWTSHNMLQVERRSELWEPIAGLPQRPIPEPLYCYLSHDSKTGDTCYGPAEETPYGDRMTYTTAADLLTLKDHEYVQDSWKNRAVWAYLGHMPSDWKIVLYWH